MTKDDAIKLATQRFNNNPNYAQKIIHKFPAPLVEPSSIETGAGDLWGLWYEALYESAMKWPEKATTSEKLHLVISYRWLIDEMRKRHQIKRKQISVDIDDATYVTWMVYVESIREYNDSIDYDQIFNDI